MEFNNKSGSEFGGGTLHIKVWVWAWVLIALFDFDWFCGNRDCWACGFWLLLDLHEVSRIFIRGCAVTNVPDSFLFLNFT